MLLGDLVRIQLHRLDIAVSPAEVYIISYPKAGRTWLRALLGKAVCLRAGLPDDLVLQTLKVTTLAGIAPTRFIHEHAGLVRRLPWRRLPTSKREFRGKRVLLLTRDIRDVLVSSYFHATRRNAVFAGSMSAFVRSEVFGARKVAEFYRIWQVNQHLPRAFLLMRYEDLHADAAASLTRALDFIGARDTGRAIIDAAVTFATFDNLQRLEREGRLEDRRLRPANARDPDSYKVRRGRVAGYADYLDDDDLAYIESVLADTGHPFAPPST
jgi:hypothetical protein